ncbi:4Fe-4S binding protein [Candidatus Woesearchaeota archaeon]|nr:4Fe-4S binding protein [Candidatus Woesearchaeota archaeon]
MAKLTYKQIPIGGMIENPGSSLDFKTGDWKVFRPCWDKKKCIHCMFCVVYCPDNCIPVANEGYDESRNNSSKKEIRKEIKQEVNNLKRKETDFDYCKGCGICAKVCPVKCIKMEEDKE